MHRLARAVVFASLGLLLVTAPAGADDGWEQSDAFRALMRQEAKTLRPLLRSAQKSDYRRQAYYLADRLLAADPEDETAAEVLGQWTPDELEAGQTPSKGFLKKRDQTLRRLGDAWFNFGETLEASGMDPVKYYPVNVRAHAYGSEAGPLVSSLQQAGYMWLGTFVDRERAKVEELLGPFATQVSYPPEYDDDYLVVRCRWPEAKVVRWGPWRLFTDHAYEEALHLVRMLAELESWAAKALGGKARKRGKDEPTDVLVFRDAETFTKIAVEFLHADRREEDGADLLARGAGTDPWRDRVIVSSQHPTNPWVAGEGLMLGAVGATLARRQLGKGAGGLVHGRGAWILMGLAGALEGFRLDADGAGWIDPGNCWRVAVAAALRSTGQLLPWDELMDFTWDAARDHPRLPEVAVTVTGTERVAKSVDVVKAQATALVVGLLKADAKSPKKAGKLLGDLYKRDSLPDIDKAMGWQPGRAIEEATRAMDAAAAK